MIKLNYNIVILKELKMNENNQPENSKQIIDDYDEAKRELDKLNYFDNYPIIKEFYLSVLSENNSTYLIKEIDSKGKEHFYFENDMLEFFNEHENFLTEEDFILCKTT